MTKKSETNKGGEEFFKMCQLLPCVSLGTDLGGGSGGQQLIPDTMEGRWSWIRSGTEAHEGWPVLQQHGGAAARALTAGGARAAVALRQGRRWWRQNREKKVKLLFEVLEIKGLTS